MSSNQFYFEISELSWERIFLTIDISTNYKGNVRFCLERFKMNPKKGRDDSRALDCSIMETIPLLPKEHSEGKYMLLLNIVAVKGRDFLNNGRWRIMAITDAGSFVCYASHTVAYHFDEYTRVFRYGSADKYAYTISFSSLTEDETNLWFLMNSYFMETNNRWKKRHYIREASTKMGKLRGVYRTAAYFFIHLFYQIVEHLYPKKGKRILIMSENKDYLMGNLKAIDDRLKERHLDSEFKISYSFRKSVGERLSIASWVKTIFLIAKQDYIFVDDYVPLFGFVKLNKHTKLIQVWHAGVGFKSVGYSRFGKDGTPFAVGTCHKRFDYVLVGSKALIPVFSEVFGIEEATFLPVGMPRLDGFLDSDKIASFRDIFYRTHPEWKTKKIILFAPTFRGTDQKHAYYNYDWLNLREIYDLCGDTYVFLVKMHPFVSEPIQIPSEYASRIVDYSSWPNINELYYVTDLLITDYSSNYYEYSLMQRPVLFYTPDREIYELSRGVHRSVKDCAPGKVCDTFEEMVTAIRQEDFEEHKIHQFVKDNFAEYNGHASDKVIDTILLSE